MIEEKLDLLSEFQAQADLLALDKQRLLDEVKIPAEVLSVQDEANKARQAIDSDFHKKQNLAHDYSNYLIDELLKPELPPEYVAAMESYRLECEQIRRQWDADNQVEQEKVAAAKAKIDADLQAKVADVYAQVAIRKAEISAEFDDKAAGVLDNIAKLTAEIKQAVKDAGKTVKGKYFMAVWVKGRDGGWDTAKLQGYALAHPEILTAKKPDGDPSVTIRKI